MVQLEININKTKLSGNHKLLSKLFEHLSFKHPNAYFIQQKVKRHWDGMIHPMTEGGVISTGLLDSVLEYLVEHGEEDFRIKDHRQIPEFHPELVTKFRGIELRPYQADSIVQVKNNNPYELIRNPRGILQMSMNAGKTIIAMGLYENIIGAKVLILVNSSVLYRQFVEDLKNVYPNEYGCMQGKKVKWGDIMVCMIPTLKNRLKEYRKELLEYNTLLVDECDLAANKSAETIYKALWHIGIRLGLTGTAFIRSLAKDRVRNIEMRKIFGEALLEITIKDLEDLGISTPVDVIMYTGNDRDMGSPDYITEFSEAITHNKKRTRKLIRLIKKQKREGYTPILLVNKFVEQCEIMYEAVNKAFPNTSTGIIHTNTSLANKKEAIRDFKDGTIEILVANLLIKRGMNFPLIQTVINNSGGEHPSGPLQVLGRGSRKHKSKRRFRFIDFFDKGRYLSRHSKRRMIQYKREKLNIVRGGKLK